MIAIIDYGMGNLRSVQKALERTGAKAMVTQNPEDIRQASKVVLPGVGAMGPAMEKLRALHFLPAIAETTKSGKPFLGICLGLQLLFEVGFEGGEVTGLGVLKGSVERFQSLKIPHMGWNQLQIIQKKCPLFTGIKEGTNVYFCHSYYVKPQDKTVVATQTDYGINYTSAIWQKNIFGVQFHPEKSQAVGLRILENFTKVKS